MQDLFSSQNIIQGGGILLAVYLAYILYRTITNHEKHFIEAIKDNTEVLRELKDVILNLK